MSHCVRCQREGYYILCPRCIEAKQEYVDAVNEAIRAGIPVDLGMLDNRDMDQEDIVQAAQGSQATCPR